MKSEKWRVKNPYVKWKVKSEKWRIQWLREKWKVKSEKSNGLSQEWKVKWFKWWYRKKQVLGNTQPNLMFSFCSSNPLPFFSCSLVLLSFKKPCSLVFPKPCSSVLMSFPKNHVLLFSCLPQKPCSSVLMSSPKNMFFCLTPLAWYGSETVPPTLSVNKTH